MRTTVLPGSPELASYLRGLPLAELDAEVDDSHLVPYSDHFHFTLAGIASLMAVTSRPASGGGWAHTAADTLDKLDMHAVREAAVATARIVDDVNPYSVTNRALTGQEGIFIAGTASGPKTIAESIVHAGQSAGEVMKYLGRAS